MDQLTKPRRSGRERLGAAFPAAVVLAGLALSSAAGAHEFCVTTAAQLQQALADSGDGGPYVAEVNQIDVVQGTYETGSATGNGPFTFVSSGLSYLTLLGGYTPGCGARDAKASLTILDGKHATQVLSIRSKTGGFTVSGFTIQNGETDAVGAGLSMDRLVGDAGIIWVTGNIIRNNHTTNVAGGVFLHTGAGTGNGLLLQANLIAGNSADGGSGAGRMLNDGDYLHVFNNTITDNSTILAEGTGGLYCDNTDGEGFILNNILWSNTNSGIYLTSNSYFFEYNDVGTRGGVTPVDLVGNVSVSPSFINAGNGNYRLAGDSPLLGFSPTLPQGSDADGHSNPTSGRMDLGAFETTIFIDQFGGFGGD